MASNENAITGTELAGVVSFTTSLFLSLIIEGSLMWKVATFIAIEREREGEIFLSPSRVTQFTVRSHE